MRWPWTKNDADLEREVRFHLESLADEYQRQGFSRKEAVLRARREFGGVGQYKELCRDERRWRALARVAQDVRFGLRMLRKTPAVTAAAVLSLALGIGATTAIYSLMDAVLWRTLPVPQPEQLTEVLWESRGYGGGVFRGSSGGNYKDGPLNVADFFGRAAFDALRASGNQVAETAAHRFPEDVSTRYAGRTAVARLRAVSGNFFHVLGLQPAAGRLLTPGDGAAAAPLTVVMSHQFWRSDLGYDAHVVGKTLGINGRVYVIAGILPPAFHGISPGDAVDLYTTLEHAPTTLEPDSWYRKAASNPMMWCYQLLARRAPGVSLETAAVAMQPLFRSSWAVAPKEEAEAPRLRLQNAGAGLGDMRREYRNPFRLLFALVGTVLLIACANIANLLLARADSRRREAALRVALGCSRARLMCQFFTESALLAVLGGALSVAVAYATANFAVTLMPGDLRLEFQPDLRMIAATLAVTLLAALLFGLYPAWRAARADALPDLKEGSGAVGGVRRGRFSPGKVLVLAQVSLGVLLVVAGAAFAAHLRQIVIRDAGFDRTRLLLFDLRPGQVGYEDARLRQFYLALERRLRDVPGVTATGLAIVRPMRGGGWWDQAELPGSAIKIRTAVNFVTSGYLEALGVPVIAGRGITPRDVETNAAVGVVSEDFARELGRPPLGVTFPLDGRTVQIVGVTARARYSRLTEQPNVLYMPNALSQDTATVVLRTAGPPLKLLRAVREAIAELDAKLPLVRVMTMEEQIAATLRRERLFAWLCGAFGVLALVLCMVGLYGVMSYAASRRRQEMGIRMALGASPGDILRHVVGEGMGLALAGCVLGAPITWWAAQKYVDYKQLEMENLDPLIVAGAVAALALSALLAVLGPAIRAASANPMRTLRDG